MLDRRFILENPDIVKKNIQSRHMNVDVDAFVTLENQRRALQSELETLRAEANHIAKNRDLSIDEKRHQGSAIKQKEQDLAAKLAPLEAEIHDLHLRIPNLTAPQSPVGEEADSIDIARGAAPIPAFNFAPKDHVELMESLGMVNLTAGAKVAGSGFYYLTGPGALLEMALTRFALDKVMKAGFKPIITPDLARDSLMIGAGFVPRGNESNTYRVEESDLNLIATSEITLVGMHADEILKPEDLPICYAGLSHCFRSERAHGSATRGIYRVHQFSKTEMVILCHPDEAETQHLRLLELEKDIFDALEIPYRVLEIATGDLGAAAYRKFDLEAWMPGRQTGANAGNTPGEWGEITSTSNCTDYQARRLNIRFKEAGEGSKGKTRFVATLNGTALSVCRAMVALVENHQTQNGTVRIPAALQPYFGASEITAPAGSDASKAA